MTDEFEPVTTRTAVGTETITLTEVILGLRPYVLIEADVDPADGALVLKVNAGGGAGEEPAVLPMLMLTEMPAESNPISQVLAALFTEIRDAELGGWLDSDAAKGGALAALRMVAKELNVPLDVA